MYRNPDLSDKIFCCWLMTMAKLQSVHRKESFLPGGDVNAHHEERLGSSSTNVHNLGGPTKPFKSI